MHARKVSFDGLQAKCKRELLNNDSIPVCVKRTGVGIHDDFRPINLSIANQPSSVNQPQQSTVNPQRRKHDFQPPARGTSEDNSGTPTNMHSQKPLTSPIGAAVLGTAGALGALGVGRAAAKRETSTLVERALANVHESAQQANEIETMNECCTSHSRGCRSGGRAYDRCRDRIGRNSAL